MSTEGPESLEQVDSAAFVISTHDTLTPDGGQFWLNDSMFEVDKRTGMHYPSFAVQEVAKTFFGHEADWLRWRMRTSKPDKKTGEIRYPDGFFLLNGEPMEFKRKPVVDTWWETDDGLITLTEEAYKDLGKTEKGKKNRESMGLTRQYKVDEEAEIETARYYTLADIERMAHALAQQNIIDGMRLMHIIVMVRCCARLYGVAV